MPSIDVSLGAEAVSLDGARQFTDLGDRMLRQAIDGGVLRAHRARRRVVILKRDLRAFLNALPPCNEKTAA